MAAGNLRQADGGRLALSRVVEGFMKSNVAVLGGALLAAALTSAPAQGWQVSADEHAKHHPAGEPDKATPAPQAKGMAGMKGMDMAASSAKLDALVTKMNAAQGAAKVDAIAELLTALVQQHQAMHGNMGEMMSKMKDGAAK
jgi:hypothetical protein